MTLNHTIPLRHRAASRTLIILTLVTRARREVFVDLEEIATPRHHLAGPPHHEGEVILDEPRADGHGIFGEVVVAVLKGLARPTVGDAVGGRVNNLGYRVGR